MKRSKFSECQIVNILKEAETGVTLEDLIRQHRFSKASFYKWKAKYGEMLDAYLFDNLEEVSAINERWLEEYNTIRPYEALQG